MTEEHLNAIMVHPEVAKSMRDEYYGMSKLEWFIEGFFNISYIMSCYGHDDFWEALSWGWCCEYIYPYDDPYNPYLSPERRMRLGRW